MLCGNVPVFICIPPVSVLVRSHDCFCLACYDDFLFLFRKAHKLIPDLKTWKGREKLSNIETKTGVALKVIDNNLYINGSTEQEKKVIREIKAIVVR